MTAQPTEGDLEKAETVWDKLEFSDTPIADLAQALAAERERCAQKLDTRADFILANPHFSTQRIQALREAAAAIRSLT